MSNIMMESAIYELVKMDEVEVHPPIIQNKNKEKKNHSGKKKDRPRKTRVKFPK
jgi:hypothetical protein